MHSDSVVWHLIYETLFLWVAPTRGVQLAKNDCGSFFGFAKNCSFRFGLVVLFYSSVHYTDAPNCCFIHWLISLKLLNSSSLSLVTHRLNQAQPSGVLKQESLADAKVSVRQQCMNEDP